MKSKGVGDTIAKITKATGIDKVVNLLFDDCGCEERKEKLNKLFPYKVECLEQKEFEYLKVLYDTNVYRLSIIDREKIIPIYNRVFNKRQKQTSCQSCWVSIMRELKVIYNEYDKTKD